MSERNERPGPVAEVRIGVVKAAIWANESRRLSSVRGFRPTRVAKAAALYVWPKVL